jgi:hypothetical protein
MWSKDHNLRGGVLGPDNAQLICENDGVCLLKSNGLSFLVSPLFMLTGF